MAQHNRNMGSVRIGTAMVGLRPPCNDNPARITEDQAAVYKKALRDATFHLVRNVAENGFIAASSSYGRYDMDWLRDSAMVAMALFMTGDADAIRAGHRINMFDIMVIEKHINGIRKGLNLPMEDRRFFNLEHHIPPRVDPNGDLFKGTVTVNGKTIEIDDTSLLHMDCGQRQFDSIPLVLMSLDRENSVRGLDGAQKQFLNKNADVLLSYMGKSYFMECAGAWEWEHHKIHAYDVMAAYAGINAVRSLAASGAINIGNEKIDMLTRPNPDYRGPLDFLKKHFINGDRVIYRAKMPFADAGYGEGVDIAEIYGFSMFGINDAVLGVDGSVAATLRKIDDTLLSNNVLPIRFKGDPYFTGGRWLPPGLEYAAYLARNGDVLRAARIVGYVVGKYGTSLPEQELVNPESPGVDHEALLAENRGNPIPDLAWSHASMIRACKALGEGTREEALVLASR